MLFVTVLPVPAGIPSSPTASASNPVPAVIAPAAPAAQGVESLRASASIVVSPVASSFNGGVHGLSLVVGLANPQWPHVGFGYRHGHLGGAIDLGSVRTANALSAAVRLFYTHSGWSPYLAAGVSASQLVTLNPSFAAGDQTPQDVFFSEFVGAGYQFVWPHLVVNLGLGIPFVPARSTAPPTVLIGSGLLPHLDAEVGYAF